MSDEERLWRATLIGTIPAGDVSFTGGLGERLEATLVMSLRATGKADAVEQLHARVKSVVPSFERRTGTAHVVKEAT